MIKKAKYPNGFYRISQIFLLVALVAMVIFSFVKISQVFAGFYTNH